LQPGYIYCYQGGKAESNKEFLKIGLATTTNDGNLEGDLNIQDPSSPPREVQKRLDEWSKCNDSPKLLFWAPIPQAVHTIESCIHLQLNSIRHVKICARHKTHDEWFKTDEDMARRVIGLWQHFSKMMPYDSSIGFLSNRWSKQTSQNLDTMTTRRKDKSSSTGVKSGTPKKKNRRTPVRGSVIRVVNKHQ
jgi:hypothetical protein